MWGKWLSIVVGAWMIASAAVFDMDTAGQHVMHIAGPLAITFSVIALWHLNRHMIKANLLVSAFVLVAPLFAGLGGTWGIVSAVASSVVLGALAFVKTKVSQLYGGGWRSLVQKKPPHLQAAAGKK